MHECAEPCTMTEKDVFTHFSLGYFRHTHKVMTKDDRNSFFVPT